MNRVVCLSMSNATFIRVSMLHTMGKHNVHDLSRICGFTPAGLQYPAGILLKAMRPIEREELLSDILSLSDSGIDHAERLYRIIPLGERS
jgi:hypothetical protein